MKRALIVIIASLAGLLPASAQDYEKHGEIISVNLANKEITVSMDAAYSVVVGTSGNVIETENIFGRDEKSAIAVIEVSKVDGRNVTCSILNSNTNPSGEMYVSFESVQAVSEAGRLVIKAIPAGAVINLDGTDRGPAPQTFDLASGQLYHCCLRINTENIQTQSCCAIRFNIYRVRAVKRRRIS